MYGYIYRTTDTSNGKIYIGQHKSEVFDNSYFGSGVVIKSIKKKRPQDLTTEVIEWCETRSELNEREKYWITTFDSQNGEVGYNLAEGGEGGVTRIGFKHTEETKKKLSESHKGFKHTEETKKKMSESRKGKYSGEKNPNYGKHLSEETKKKLSESHKGLHHSKESKKKISEYHKGLHHSKETKKKISESKKGKPAWNKGKQQQKHIFITLDYDLAVMGKSNAYNHHPDWVLVE